jgi:Protein of unknown function (DUF3892)
VATYQITAVQVQKTSSDPHEHITSVKIGTSGAQLSLSTVVANLRNPNGDRYITYGGGERANVYVRTCPRCTFRDYITTTPDGTTKNNLLSLPRF